MLCLVLQQYDHDEIINGGFKMTNNTAEKPQVRYARLAGFALLLWFQQLVFQRFLSFNLLFIFRGGFARN
ncbi:hypothetical protein SAMN05216524_103392 [Mucilaginibacter sp. OK098]|nr:hypothetical protein SAMN05216524_103392 [Mucilaginibacter sp. OK098]